MEKFTSHLNIYSIIDLSSWNYGFRFTKFCKGHPDIKSEENSTNVRTLMSENGLAFVPSHRKISNTRYIWPVFSSFKDIIYLFLTNMRNIRKIRKIFRIFIFLALIWLLPSILSKNQLFFKFLWRFHCIEKFCDLPTLDCNITARWIFLEISQFLFLFFFALSSISKLEKYGILDFF